jgi:hypothetical protein
MSLFHEVSYPINALTCIIEMKFYATANTSPLRHNKQTVMLGRELIVYLLDVHKNTL